MADHILGVEGPSVTIPTGVPSGGGGPSGALVPAPFGPDHQAASPTLSCPAATNTSLICVQVHPTQSWISPAGYLMEAGWYLTWVTLLSVPISASGYGEARGPQNAINRFDLSEIGPNLGGSGDFQLPIWDHIVVPPGSEGTINARWVVQPNAGATTFSAFALILQMASVAP